MSDETAFQELVEPHRAELLLHCYRILGSLQDAEDVLQEALLAAWRGFGEFEGRASLRTWLYRIATNRCLNALRDRSRRPKETAMVEPPEPTRLAEPIWIEPYPDALIEPGIAGPEATYEQRESIGLAYLTALQLLPPRQRAALVLREVLGFRAAEVADMLGVTETSVKSALQRARATLDERATSRERAPAPRSPREVELVARFAAAVERGDTAGVVSLLTDDAWLTMPPEPYEYQGAEAIARFLDDRAARRGAPLRLVPTRANGQPAFGCYLPDPQAAIARPYGIMVLTLGARHVCAITWFGERSLMARFGLPQTLPDEGMPEERLEPPPRGL